jgi:hypothetical protein
LTAHRKWWELHSRAARHFKGDCPAGVGKTWEDRTMSFASNSNLWAVAGMVYALAGAALLCNAVFLNPAPARAMRGSEIDNLRRLSAQWLDSRIGAALLVTGFFLQATGALGTATLNTPAVFVLLGLAFAISLYAMVKDLVVEDLLGVHASQDDEPIVTPAPKEPASLILVAAEESAKVVELRTGSAD